MKGGEQQQQMVARLRDALQSPGSCAPPTAPHRAPASKCTWSPCSLSAASSATVPTPRLTPDSGWRRGGRKQGVAPLRTRACTADLCASRGRITTLLLLLPLLLLLLSSEARELCHCTQAMIEDSTPHVLGVFSPIRSVEGRTNHERERGGRRERGREEREKERTERTERKVGHIDKDLGQTPPCMHARAGS